MKNCIVLLFTVCLYCFGAIAQPYHVGHRTINFTDTNRSRAIQTEVYYPADTDGDNVTITQLNTDKFPLVIFGHGFVVTWDAYTTLWNALVAEGFIVAFPITETGFSPQHAELGKDLAFLVDALQVEGQNSGSAFFNRVDSTSCVMGHSMGGGASFLAVQYNTHITALANLAAAETNPSAIQAASGITLPALMFAGENDCVTPIAGNQLPMYDSLHSTCKSLITIHGGSHCQMADANVLCSIGESSCTPAPAISRATQQATINRLLIPWLNFQLKGNCPEGLRFDSLVTNDTAVSVLRNCQLCTSSYVNEPETEFVLSYSPNPFTEDLQVNFGKMDFSELKWSVSDVLGKKINFDAQRNANGYRLRFPSLQSGIYLVKVQSKFHQSVFKIFRK